MYLAGPSIRYCTAVSFITALQPRSGTGAGHGPYVERYRQLLAVGQWFPPGRPTPVSNKQTNKQSFCNNAQNGVESDHQGADDRFCSSNSYH